jgi:signal transduction histidine kinase
MSRGLDRDELRQVSKVFDACFGGYAVIVALFSMVAALRGWSSWAGFFGMLWITVSNITLSAWFRKIKDPFWHEVIRMHLFNGANCVLLYLTVDGPLAPYWPAFFSSTLASATYFAFLTRNRPISYASTLFGLSLFLVTNSLSPRHSLPFMQSLLLGAMILVTSALLIELVGLLKLTIANEKLARGQLIQAGKLAALGEMAGGVAHEINNPLATIQMLSGQLREVSQEEMIDRGAIALMTQKIEATTHRITRIVTGLRTFSRDGRGDPVERADVGRIIDDALALCSERFRTQGIELRIVQPRAGLQFACRPTQIVQVLVNLMNNAFDAVEKLEHRWVELQVVEVGEWVDILVTDSGGGISQGVLDKMFQPFFTTKDIGKGTGLGLSLSKGLIESHEGSLFVDTECERTRFVIRMPALARAAA